MRVLFAGLLLFVGAVAATRVRPMTQELCTGSHYEWKDYSAMYSNATGVVSSMCIFSDYEEVCADVTGLVACDNYNMKCEAYRSDQKWTAKNAANGNKYISTEVPKTCTGPGAFWYPDARVLAVAQVIITSLCAIAGVGYVAVNLRTSLSPVSLVALVLMLPTVIVLSVSYYYLNGIVVISAAFAASGLFAVRSPVFGALGMLVCLSALFWVTYESGLGGIQHHSRRMAGGATQDTYEKMCNQYYRGFFYKSDAMIKDNDNPNVEFIGYCQRNFIAGELFVVILLELLLVLFASSGAAGCAIPEKEEAPAPAAEGEASQ